MDKEFTSDYCSVVPDYDQRECCVRHDFAYWKGGTLRERRKADRMFLDCVSQTRSGWLAPFRWLGVRLGGLGILPTTFRWGYGWNWPTTKAPKNDNSEFSEQSQLRSFEKKLAEAKEKDRQRRKEKTRAAAG